MFAMNLPLDPYLEYALRMLAATFAGALVGIERDLKGKPTGMRTLILICLGSCVIMILSVEVARRAGSPADPGRIAAQVVTGIGFLGAGSILRSRVTVSGLTTAATIWFVAGVGLVLGYGDYLLGGVATALMILTLTALLPLEKRIEVSRRLHILRIEVDGPNLSQVRNALIQSRVLADDVELKRLDDGVRIDIEYVAVDRKHQGLIAQLQGLDGVRIVMEY